MIVPLMLPVAEGKTALVAASASEWVQHRRPSSAGNKESAGSDGGNSIALASGDDAVEADPKAEARATAARERTRKDREEAITAGLEDLDQWITDQVKVGLAGFSARAGKMCRVIAQRMVDAKAPGLAARLEMLTSRLYALPEPARPRIAVGDLGQLHLIA